jgi:hypothetical protein
MDPQDYIAVLQDPNSTDWTISVALQNLELHTETLSISHEEFQNLLERGIKQLTKNGDCEGVVSGIRTLSASLPLEQMDRILQFISPENRFSDKMIDLVLQRIYKKAAHHKAAHNKMFQGPLRRNIELRAYDIAQQYIQPDVLRGSRNASIAISALMVLLTTESLWYEPTMLKFRAHASPGIVQLFERIAKNEYWDRLTGGAN